MKVHGGVKAQLHSLASAVHRDWSVSLRPRPLYSRAKRPRYPPNWTLGGPQRQPDLLEKRTISHFRRASKHHSLGRAMAQTVSRQCLIVETWVQCQASPRGISGGLSSNGASLCPSNSVFPRKYHSTNAPYRFITDATKSQQLTASHRTKRNQIPQITFIFSQIPRISRTIRNYSRCWKWPPPPQSLQITMLPQFAFESLRIKTRFWQTLRIFAHYIGFSALHIPLSWLLMYTSPVKNKVSYTRVPSCVGHFAADCRTTAQLVANRNESRHWACAERLSIRWKCQL
jgi:hypothetical protein